MTRSVSVGVAVVAGLACLTAPLSSQATVTAYPTGPFNLKYGATYAKGIVTFYGRSVTAQAEYKSVNDFDCRGVRIEALDSRGHKIDDGAFDVAPPICNDSTSYPLTAPANVPGGAISVRVVLVAHNPTTGISTDLGSQRVFPS